MTRRGRLTMLALSLIVALATGGAIAWGQLAPGQAPIANVCLAVVCFAGIAFAAWDAGR